MTRVFEAVCDVMLGLLTVPALDKWLSVHPVVCDLGLPAFFHNVGPQAMAGAHGLRPLPDTISESESEGANVGAPQDPTRAFRRTARKRSSKALEFYTDEKTPMTLLLWAIVANHLMHLHYFLFRDGTSSWRNLEESQTTLIHLCCTTTSRARKAS